jgi:SAM-dependent methyltransferase
MIQRSAGEMCRIPLTAGRRTFGDDPASYAAARPDYPDALYARLVERCGLRAGVRVFEVGAGTGLATRRLLALGASPLLAIEPDERLAAFLAQAVGDNVLRIDRTPFEEAQLPLAHFDLGVAATSFHWLEQAPALAKAYAALKPGGWWAMWWTNFGADAEVDAFQSATDHLFANTASSPSHGEKGRPQFALDRERRLHDLASAKFGNAEVDIWCWTLIYDTERLIGLYNTFSPIQALAPDRRKKMLREIARIADEQFGGRVERPFVTALYTAQRG